MQFKHICTMMISDLQSHKFTDRETLFANFVQARLAQSFNSYEAEMISTLKYLSNRETLNLLKKMNRL